ncbi:M23 family metallopeptidase [Pedobacter duraquae]|uniref:Peptidase M23-like protein n=1 Tax=Pedobacter duraquae TaxID=425511 RepID=A0A4R6ICN0_9SPHI|nr:M23 family metallopeptidase [Pedobacter duraquae]TDO19337.1 peptidase M23-like protein [Pedobacter duraquae]
MKFKNNLKIGLILILLGTIYSCKKELYDQAVNSDIDRAVQTKNFQSEFLNRNYENFLRQKMSETEEIYWKVGWDASKEAKVNDSTTYYYYQLTPYVHNKKGVGNDKIAQEVNLKKFLLVGKTSNFTFFRIATYYFDSQNKKQVVAIGDNYSFEKFSGDVVYQNLDLKNSSSVSYLKGVNTILSLNKGKTSELKPNTTSYTVTECKTVLRCSYATSCGQGAYVTSTKSEFGCVEPNFIPNGCATFSGWTLTFVDSNYECKDVTYPDPGFPGTPGGAPTNPIPCPGDPLSTMKIAPSGTSNTQGGRWGMTRIHDDGTGKGHWGLDISAPVGTPLYPIAEGTVVRIVRNAPTGKISESFGNLIEIQTTLPNGDILKTLYGHLTSVPNSINVGSSVTFGTLIGLSGKTGNAWTVTNKHVHIQTKINGVKKNPEPYVRTKFTANGTPVPNPC